MISYQKKFIRIVECWNGEEPKTEGADLIRRFQQSQPLSHMLCRAFYTVLIDLKVDQEIIFANMKRGTRYEIRRAETEDHLAHGYWDGNDCRVFDEFCDYADEFLRQKRQPRLDRSWLRLLAEERLLDLTHTANTSGEKLVWHAYHRNTERVTLLYSASFFRNSDLRTQVGRANRLHHWLDMLRYKNAGIATYDFGGWYDGTKDEERLRINKFKEQFGGEVVRNHICEQALTLRGALFLRLRSALLGNAI